MESRIAAMKKYVWKFNVIVFHSFFSIFARQFVKDIFSLFLPKELYRQFYVLVASASIVLLVYCWKPMPAVVWELKSPLSYAIWGTYNREEYSSEWTFIIGGVKVGPRYDQQ